ncbi:MAG: flagellar hook protein FlgE [Myxococcota bacterium]
MSLLNNLNTASSGLGVSSTSMSVIGDNIANLNTVGFKGSRANFGDLLPNDVGGLSGMSSIGTGAATDTVATLFGQGSIEGTNNSLDMAINGGGFFMVRSGDEMMYTRAGQFGYDDNGYIVTAGGMRLQGYGAEGGVIGRQITDLRVDTPTTPPNLTSMISMSANLDSSVDPTDTPIADGTVVADGATSTINAFASAGDFSSSVTVYDSLGEAHEVTVVYEKTADNTWSYYAVVDAGELDGGGTEGNAFLISSGELSFDTDGQLTGFTQNNVRDTGTPWSFLGAEPGDYDLQFGVDVNGLPTEGGITQNAGDSAVSAVSQDGYGLGYLSSVEIDQDGVLVGTYTNGEELQLGQVLLANFPGQGGLERVGGSMYKATISSGEPAVGVAGTAGRGDLIGAALEGSNVELEDQFVNMIGAQRSYQANSRVFSSTNDLLQELVNLV